MGIRAGLWLVYEIIVDIGAVHEMSIGLFSAADALGAMGLMFALGLLLGALVCRLLRRKLLACHFPPRRQLSRCTSASHSSSSRKRTT